MAELYNKKQVSLVRGKVDIHAEQLEVGFGAK